MRTRSRLSLFAMILITAALSEELGIALDLCERKSRLRRGSLRAWSAARSGKGLYLLKTGVGPTRAQESLSLFLRSERPSLILVVGYAGALQPELRLGDLIVPQRAHLLKTQQPKGATSEGFELAGTWRLADLCISNEDRPPAGLTLHRGDVLTAPFIIGEPAHKSLLHRRFRAYIVDMETAALARQASRVDIPLACVRAVSDEAADDFLAPFSFGPFSSPASRVMRVLAGGNWIRRYGQWKERAAVARRSLRDFLIWYLDSH